MGLNKTFLVRKIVSDENFKSLREHYDNTPCEYAHQDYSLHHVEKTTLHSRNLIALKELDEYYDRLGYKHKSSYFLRYVQYSWTRPHHDNIGTPTKTAITLIEEKDLEGGETLVWDKHYDLPAPKGSYVKKTGSIHRKNEIPCTPRLQPGESLLYDDNIQHAVAQVRSGHRIVLVSWYSRE